MIENMRGLFFIVKGTYRKGVEPSFTNTITNGVNYIGGYDPEDPNTEEWYMLIDSVTYTCMGTGSTFEKVVKGVYNLIKKYKGDKDLYVRRITNVRNTTPSVVELYKHIYNTFGDYYLSEIEEMEDLAYTELKENTPLNRGKKLMAKTKKTKGLVKTTPKKEEVIETKTPKKLVKPKIKVGVKKLAMTE